MPDQKLPRRIELRSEEHIASGIRNPLHKSKCAVFLENEHDNLVELIQYAEREGYKTDVFHQTPYYGNTGHLSLIKMRRFCSRK